ncbi:nicotinamide mononucleotide transporter PnuC [Dolosicoccus paucivorans]|uniref:Nicotinamide mononucleotide transporter PnuC n=1 Tax=Dolosicoccus paucivorans TaxID=84521 RepID=A0A2N6SPY5_9LACT|nr:nicotinamide riboside transporter PnuC [Dolosicoccus paucivorans]PMC59131.1 nicotinamide mononucleotide transporter PnuC [Dolosicoccus paucivorans]
MERTKSFFADWTTFEKVWLVVSTILITTTSIIMKDTPLTLVSSIAGVISVVLTAKGKIENFYFGMFQVVTYAYICYHAHLYGEVMYNLAMVPAIIIGYINWKRHMQDGDSEVSARNLSKKGWIILIIGTLAAIAFYNLFLQYLGGNFTLMDAVSTTFSVVATILMLARYSEQWIMWLSVNVASILLWLMSAGYDGSGYTIMVMWGAYFFNSLYGFLNWRKMAAQSKKIQ